MSTSITFPAPAPDLKLPRAADKWAATLAEERRRLQEDQDALRERETNLREYEERLRAWQAQLDAGRTGGMPSKSPFATGSRAPLPVLIGDDVALQAAWEKLHRAREILEAEQNHLRDDRLTLQDMQGAVKKREEAVAAREAQLAEREKLFLAANPMARLAPATIDPQTGSTVLRMTRAPFELAKAVLGKK